jgi:hypothetical protein
MNTEIPQPQEGDLVQLPSSDQIGIVGKVSGSTVWVRWHEDERMHVHRWRFLIGVPRKDRHEGVRVQLGNSQEPESRTESAQLSDTPGSGKKKRGEQEN